MDKYLELEKLYYQKKDVEKEYQSRINNPCTVKVSLFINPLIKGRRVSKIELELFYLPIKEILLLQDKIIFNSNEIKEIVLKLPGVAKNSCINEIMMNEIVKSNQVEGVYTTKKDIYNSMSSKKVDRLTGIINKYVQIRENNIMKIDSIQEIRNMYDEIFGKDILQNPENKLDGKLFRKNQVHINDGLRNIHTGDVNEENIIKHLNDLITFMNNENFGFLAKACITHYYFEYIHPFYDGNGRFGRLLCSMYLARKLDIFTGLSLSYAIFEEKTKYSKLFSITSDIKNYGEITFFIKGFLEIIEKGQESIKEMLKDKIQKLIYIKEFIEKIKLEELEKSIIYIYAQNYIFSKTAPLKDNQLSEMLELSRPTLNKIIKKLVEQGYLEKVSSSPVIHVLTDKINI